MSHSALVAWALAAMIAKQPKEITPWADTYQDTADAFVTIAEESPLHKVENDGVRHTVADFIAVAWFESRFDPQARGDCTKKTAAGQCADLATAQSVCLFQVGKSNLTALKTSAEELLGSVWLCTRAARRLMQISASICRGRPRDEWLGQYASGGGECGKLMPNGDRAGLRESRHRVATADWLFRSIGFPTP
jgi:hypothetical protein